MAYRVGKKPSVKVDMAYFSYVISTQLVCVTVWRSGEGGTTDREMLGGWAGVSDVSRYADFKESMETSESLPHYWCI